MPEVPREVRAFAFGLMEGVGGVSYSHRDVSEMLKDRFGVTIAVPTLRNWKSDRENQMKKYSITPEYIQEVIARGLSGSLNDKDTPSDVPSDTLGDAPKDTSGILPGTKDAEDEKVVPAGTVKELLTFTSIPEMISYMDGKGYLVGSERDIISQLEANGLSVFKKGQLHVGSQIFSWKPIELDLGAIGKGVVTNPIIAFWYAVYRRFCENKGREPVDLVAYVTDCVNDANTSRKLNLALIRGELE